MIHTTTSSFVSGISIDALLLIKFRYQMPIYVICIFAVKNSFVKNLPYPSIQISDNRSYTSIRQCTSHFFAGGKIAHVINMSEPSFNKCITYSKMSRAAAQRGYGINSNVDHYDVIILLALQWSDVFDPNSSIKSNRGTIWIKIVTFISEQFQEKRLENTFPISIG